LTGAVVDQLAGLGPTLTMAAIVLAAGALATWLPSVPDRAAQGAGRNEPDST